MLDDQFKTLQNNYHFDVYTQNENRKIGEPNRDQRVCRFCGETQKTGATFKKKAHALSEGIGNKAIILNEECDSCNEQFGNTIEQDLQRHFELFIIIAGNKGKNGYRKKKDETHYIQSNGQSTNIVSHNNKTQKKSNHKPLSTIELNSSYNIATVNIYRALCKYALSVIPSAELSKFNKTIQWIKGTKVITKLPECFLSVAINQENSHPQLMLHIRKNNNKELPYLVVNLHIGSIIIIYIVPGCNRDDRDFTALEDFSLFESTFCHLSMEWKKENYNSYTKTVNNFAICLQAVKENKSLTRHLKQGLT